MNHELSGWLKVIKVLELTGGALILANAFVAVGLCLLGPVIVNIFLFHIFLAPAGLPLALVVLVLEIFLIYHYRDRFASIFRK